MGKWEYHTQERVETCRIGVTDSSTATKFSLMMNTSVILPPLAWSTSGPAPAASTEAGGSTATKKYLKQGELKTKQKSTEKKVEELRLRIEDGNESWENRDRINKSMARREGSPVLKERGERIRRSDQRRHSAGDALDLWGDQTNETDSKRRPYSDRPIERPERTRGVGRSRTMGDVDVKTMDTLAEDSEKGTTPKKSLWREREEPRTREYRRGSHVENTREDGRETGNSSPHSRKSHRVMVHQEPEFDDRRRDSIVSESGSSTSKRVPGKKIASKYRNPGRTYSMTDSVSSPILEQSDEEKSTRKVHYRTGKRQSRRVSFQPVDSGLEPGFDVDDGGV